MSSNSSTSSNGGGGGGWLGNVINGSTKRPNINTNRAPSPTPSISRLPSNDALDRSSHNATPTDPNAKGRQSKDEIISQLKRANASLSSKCADMEATFMNQCSTLATQVSEMNTMLQAQTDETKIWRQKCTSFESELREKKDWIVSLENDASFQTQSITDLKNQLYQLQSEVEDVEYDKSQLTSESEQKVLEAERQITSLEKERSTLLLKVDEVSMERNTVRVELEEVKQEMQQQQNQLQKQQKQLEQQQQEEQNQRKASNDFTQDQENEQRLNALSAIEVSLPSSSFTIQRSPSNNSGNLSPTSEVRQNWQQLEETKEKLQSSETLLHETQSNLATLENKYKSLQKNFDIEVETQVHGAKLNAEHRVRELQIMVQARDETITSLNDQLKDRDDDRRDQSHDQSQHSSKMENDLDRLQSEWHNSSNSNSRNSSSKSLSQLGAGGGGGAGQDQKSSSSAAAVDGTGDGDVGGPISPSTRHSDGMEFFSDNEMDMDSPSNFVDSTNGDGDSPMNGMGMNSSMMMGGSMGMGMSMNMGIDKDERIAALEDEIAVIRTTARDEKRSGELFLELKMKRISELEQELRIIRPDGGDSLYKENEALREENEALKKELGTVEGELNESIHAFENTEMEMEDEIAAKENEIKHLQEQLNERVEELSKLEQTHKVELVELENQVEAVKKDYSKETTTLREKISSLSNERNQSSEAVSGKESEIQRLYDTIDEYTDKIKMLEQEHDSAIAKLQSKLNAKETEMADLEVQHIDKESKLADLEKKLSATREEMRQTIEAKTNEKDASVQSQITQLKIHYEKEIRILEEQKEDLWKEQEAAVSKKNSQIEQMQKSIDELREKLAQTEALHKSEMTRLDKHIRDRDEEVVEIQQRINDKSNEIETLDKTLREKSTKITEMQSVINGNSTKVQQLEDQHATEIKDWERQYEEVRTQLEQSMTERDSVDSVLESETILSLREETTTLSQERSLMESKYTTQLARKAEEVKDIDRQMDAKSKEIFVLTRKLEDCEKKLEDMKEDIDAREEDWKEEKRIVTAKFMSASEDKTKKIDELEATVTRLKKISSGLNNTSFPEDEGVENDFSGSFDSEVEKYKADILRLREQKSKIEEEKEMMDIEYKKTVSDRDVTIAAMARTAVTQEDRIQTLNDKIKPLEEKIEQLTKERLSIERDLVEESKNAEELDALRRSTKDHTLSQQSLSKQITTLKKQVTDLKADNTKLKFVTNTGGKKEMMTLKHQVNEYKSKLKERDGAISTLVKSSITQEQQINALRDEINEVKTKNTNGDIKSKGNRPTWESFNRLQQESEIFAGQIIELDEEIEELRKDLEEERKCGDRKLLKKRVDQLDKENTIQAEQLNKNRATIDDLYRQSDDQKQNSRIAMNDMKNKMEEQLRLKGKLEWEINSLKARLKNINNDKRIVELQEDLDDMLKENKQIREDCRGLRKKLRQAEVEVDRIPGLEIELTEMRSDLEEARKNSSKRQANEITEEQLQLDLEEAIEQRDAIGKELKSLQTKFKDTERSETSLKGVERKLRDELKESQMKFEELSSKLSKVEAKRSQDESALKEFESYKNKTRSIEEGYEDKLERLRNEMKEEADEQHEIIAALTEEVKKRQFGGIHEDMQEKDDIIAALTTEVQKLRNDSSQEDSDDIIAALSDEVKKLRNQQLSTSNQDESQEIIAALSEEVKTLHNALNQNGVGNHNQIEAIVRAEVADEVKSMKDQKEFLGKEVSRLQQELESSRNSNTIVNELRKKLSESEEGRNQFEKTLMNTFERKLSLIQLNKDKSIDSLRKELTQSKEIRKQAESDLLNNIRKLENEKTELEAELEAKMQHKNAKIQFLEQTLGAHEQVSNQMKNDLDQLQSGMESVSVTRRAEVEEMQEELMDVQAKNKKYERDVTTLKMKIEEQSLQHQKELVNLKTTVSTLESENINPVVMMRDVQAQRDNQQIMGMKDKVESMKWKVSSLQEENQKLREKMEKGEDNRSSKNDKWRNSALQEQVLVLTQRVKELEGDSGSVGTGSVRSFSSRRSKGAASRKESPTRRITVKRSVPRSPKVS